jgi:hypothetical protein
MKRTKVTYGQLDRVLRSLGFTSRLVNGDPPARVYDHKETGASIMVPPFPEDDHVLEYHLVTHIPHLRLNIRRCWSETRSNDSSFI